MNNEACERAVDKINFALAAAQISVGVDQIEPLLDDLLEFVLAHPECEPALVGKFDATLDELPRGSEEILGFCMHELRWSSVHDHVQQWVNLAFGNPRKGPRYARILAAFYDDWPDRALYLRYNPARDD